MTTSICPRASLNEQIIRVPVDAAGTITLETTIYKPDGQARSR